MATSERRRLRTTEPHLALACQLAACCADGAVVAMAVADDDGALLAEAGALDVCRDVVRKVAAVAPRVRSIDWTVLGAGQPWDVSMRKFATERGDLVICAIGGAATDRQQALDRAAAGMVRIVAG